VNDKVHAQNKRLNVSIKFLISNRYMLNNEHDVITLSHIHVLRQGHHKTHCTRTAE